MNNYYTYLRVGQWLKRGSKLVEITEVYSDGWYDCIIYTSSNAEKVEYIVLSTEWEIQEM